MTTVPKFILAVDPGVKTGIAVYGPKGLVECMTLDWKQEGLVDGKEIKETIINLGRQHEALVVVVETPEAAYYPRKGVSQAAQYKIAQSVGEVKVKAEVCASIAESFALPVIRQKPVRDMTKMSPKEFAWVFPEWKGKHSEHSRDASCLARYIYMRRRWIKLPEDGDVK